jgi:very-short-patch-repair endonuclease
LCSFCINQLLCNDTECKTCFEKSFASHEKSKYWSKKNDKKPREVFKSTDNKYWFDCPTCNHEFDIRLSSIVCCGNWCSFCKRKTEKKLYEIIKPLYPSLIRQFKQDWCKNIRKLPFDFCLPDLKIIIELDGEQHFKQVSNWKSPEEQLVTDKYKEKCANDNNYSVIRVLQEDVLYDRKDWYKKLCHAIEETKNSHELVNTYLDKKKYDHF